MAIGAAGMTGTTPGGTATGGTATGVATATGGTVTATGGIVTGMTVTGMTVTGVTAAGRRGLTGDDDELKPKTKITGKTNCLFTMTRNFSQSNIFIFVDIN